MSPDEQELAPADLAALDLMIAVLQEEGKSSINLKDLAFEAGDAMNRYRAARHANERTRVLRNAARQLAQRVEGEFNIDDLTVGQLDVDIPLEELIEMRRRLGG